MDIEDLKDKLVAVLGYGQEGEAVADYLVKYGIKPVLFDQKPWEEWPKGEQEEIKKLGVNFIFGPGWLEELKGFDVAFRSPGIKLSLLTTNNSKLITSQTKWFFDHCPAKIIGVTGTKGKGTTSTLIYEILQAQSKISNPKSKIYLTGNIGKIQPLEILDTLSKNDWVVYELSSFQLQDLDHSPHIAVVLMITREHLDYHNDAAEYAAAKSSITKFQTEDDIAIVNQDYPGSKAVGELGSGKKIYFSRQDSSPVDVSGRQLRGEHNLENIYAAALAAKAAGRNANSIEQAISEFKGLEHRLEFVGNKNGIKFYNDSFSTTPETAIAAVKSFTEPLIVILGGSAKNSDFTELGQVISNTKNIKAAVLIGEEAVKIKELINSADIQIFEGAKNMPEIFEQIKTIAKSGDVVLLSPACASFDMFENYKQRGNRFKQEAQKWQ